MTVPDAHAPLWRGLSESMSADRPPLSDRGPHAPYCGPGPATLHSTDVPAPE